MLDGRTYRQGTHRKRRRHSIQTSELPAPPKGAKGPGGRLPTLRPFPERVRDRGRAEPGRIRHYNAVVLALTLFTWLGESTELVVSRVIFQLLKLRSIHPTQY